MHMTLEAFLAWPAMPAPLGAQVSRDGGLSWAHEKVREKDLVARYGSRWRLVQFPNGRWRDDFGWIVTTPDGKFRLRLSERKGTIMTFGSESTITSR